MAKKAEFIGIPIDRRTKDRLKKLAAAKQRKHTEMARLILVDGIEREEKAMGVEPELASAK